MNLLPAEAVIPRLRELQGHTVLVVGDVILDRYLVGRATRLSREAPVPVLEYLQSFSLPGSAANPALNIQSVGSQAIQAAAIGDDEAGEELLGLLAQAKVNTDGVIRLSSRRTTVKQRMMAKSPLRYPQQLLRVDWIDHTPVPRPDLQRLAERIKTHLGEIDAILASDYNGGTVSGPVLNICLEAHQNRGLPICVDAQSALERYRGFTLIKCNRDEAGRAVSRDLTQEDDFIKATQQIQSELSARMVAITRGEQGMCIAEHNNGYFSFPAANKTEVFDVVGAGDTVIALMTLGIIAGWDTPLIATVAQLGAGVVIQRMGNATPSLEELEMAARKWL